MAAVILYMSMFMFTLSGLLLAAAINHYRQSQYLFEESQSMTRRLLLRTRSF